MADFIDSEAEESEEEEELNEQERKKVKRIAMESSDEDEDDEDKLREELEDLIDDAPIEDDDESDDENRKRKISDDELDDRLEDDDYDLIEENLGMKVQRKKQFKRLKRIEDDESDEDGNEAEGHARDKIANELFDSGDEEADRSSERRSAVDHTEAPEFEEGEGEDYSDADDFIVDDNDKPIAAGKKKKAPIFSDAALQEAQDIFGVEFDFDEFERFDEDEEYSDEDEEDEYLDEETEDDLVRHKKKKHRRKVHKKSIFEIYEPSELKRGHFTDLDNEIRNADIPERMQLREVPVTSVPEGSDELDEEAKWIYNQVYAKPSVSTQDCEGGVDPRTKSKKGTQTIGKIKKALDFMRNQQLEVPFIAFYRKEYVLPELTISDLWKVYKYDAKWCQLKSRKGSLQKLYENMRDYQNEILTKDLDAPIPDDVRLIRDEDIEWIKKIQTPEEVKDMQHHFFLYYAHEIPAMQEFVRKKERERRLSMPKEKKKKTKTITNDDGEEEEVEVTDDEEGESQEKEPEEEPQHETVKPANRCGPYSLCRKANIIGFAKRFGLTPEQFGEHLRDNYQRHDLDQEPVGPLELAKEYISAKFTTPDDVLKAGKYVVATQLSREPLVVKCVREILFERAKISVTPTKRGMKEIDESHPIYTMKYLNDKPVRDLVTDQYLKLHIAEQDKLIKISVCEDLKGLTSTLYLDEVKQLYYRDEFSKYVQDWNAVRADVVETALKKMILPELYKELKTALLAEAKDHVLKRCAGKLYDWIKVAPISVDIDDEEWSTEETGGVRVMGLAYEPDLSQAAFACLCAPDGECVEILRLPNLLRRRMSNFENEKILKEADLLALRNFINTKKPHVIAVSGESREALMIQKDLEVIIKQLGEDEEFPEIKVEIVDNEFSKIYANSIKGESDFKEYPILLRQAISLARRLQDPLMEFSQLCTSDDEIMCLRYHPLQDTVSKDDLLEVITLEFVNRTNEVGVDLNEVVQNPYASNLVQFICGLGPRKGAALIKLMKQTNLRLENRTLLVTKCHMGPKVFINCAGFIKIDTDSLGSTDAYVEVLDGSRVHPETYEWARKMAVDALEDTEDPVEDTNPAGALEEILKEPDKLKELDLDAFAEELERQGFGNKSITLYDIRAELCCRYKDLRAPYQSCNTEQLFDMLTKETPESLYIGKMVMATVTGFTHKKPTEEQLNKANPNRNDETGLWQCPFCLKNDFPELSEVWNHFDAGGCPGQATGVRIRLDNGITGYIHIKKLSDSEVTNPEDRVTRGQTIHCRIIKIDTERFYVEATSRTSDLNDTNQEWRPPKDPYYDFTAEKRDKKTEEDSKKIKQRQQYIKRVIVHPAFHNISYAEAEKWMKTMDQGEVIVRPSSKGADHLTVTWKVADDLYQHIDVREEGKENSFSLGRSLWIGTEEFEDLDEIIARHVSPMAANVRELLSFRYYREECGGMRDKAEEVLRQEKRNNPNKIHYFVSLSKNYPGKFLLSYLPASRSRHEFISVTPEGFRFRGQQFDSVNSLFRWFKEHFRDPIPGAGVAVGPGGQTPYGGARQTPGGGHLPYHTPGMTPHHRGMPTPLGHHSSNIGGPVLMHPPTGAYGYPNTPYTPSGQTPFLTPYHPVTATPRVGPFATPRPPTGAAGGYGKSPGPGNFGSGSGRQHQTSASSSREFNSRSASNNQPSDPNVWAKAAAEWAKAKPSGSSSARSTPRYDARTHPSPRAQPSPRTHPSYRASPASSAPSPSASPAFSMRSGASGRGAGAGPMDMSPYSPRTPRTIASPRSMVESSIGGDMATPLYDE